MNTTEVEKYRVTPDLIRQLNAQALSVAEGAHKDLVATLTLLTSFQLGTIKDQANSVLKDTIDRELASRSRK